MDELIKALTRLANASAEYFEKQNAPLPSLDVEGPGEKTAAETITTLPPADKPKRGRPAKLPAALVVPVTQDNADPDVALPVEMTEEQSGKEVYNYAKALIQRFPAPAKDGATDKEGNPFPEGYHMARKILAVDFKVGKIADLVHAQRVQFISKVRGLIAKVDTAPAPVKTDDVGIGV